MKLKTVRVRRSSPSALALALALMLTMLCVYLVSLSALPEPETNAASGHAVSAAEVRMEGLDAAFLLHTRTNNQLEARVLAARCAQAGGAGLVLHDGGDYCVVSQVVSFEAAGENDLRLHADGLTLKLRGDAGEIAAISDCIGLLRTLAVETGSLAASIEEGSTNLSSVCSLLSVYRTRGRSALDALAKIDAQDPVIRRLSFSMHESLERLSAAIDEPDIGKIKLIHAAACAEWISILEEFAAADA